MIPKLPFLPEDHHYAIAAVATRSAQLDHMIPIILKSLLGSARTHTARFLLKKTRGLDRILLLQALLHDEFPDEGKDIDVFIAEVKRARDERNRVLHWLWGKSDTPDAAVMANIPVFGEPRSEEKTAAEIQAVADDLLKVILTLVRWNERFFERIKVSLPGFSPGGLLSG